MHHLTEVAHMLPYGLVWFQLTWSESVFSLQRLVRISAVSAYCDGDHHDPASRICISLNTVTCKLRC